MREFRKTSFIAVSVAALAVLGPIDAVAKDCDSDQREIAN